MRHRNHTPVWIAASALAVALFFSGSIGSAVHSGAQDQGRPIASDAHQYLSGFAPVVRSAAPAVVSVSSSRIVRVPRIPSDFPMSEGQLRRYFGDDALAQFGP